MACRRVKQREYKVLDCFNRLSDDIISDCILPLLDLKQRIRSSVLSRRWRNLWRQTLGDNLVFPHGLEAWDKVYHGGVLGCRKSCRHVVGIRDHYIYWVDSTLRSFAGPELNCFSVCYELDARFSQVVDRWLMCAVRLGVKKLHLHLGHVPGRNPYNNYEFPGRDKLSRLLHLDLNACTPSCILGISRLKELSLEFVNISGEALEYLVSSCPLLEFISLKKAACGYLRIVGPSLKLKYLQVLGCSPLEKLHISTPNLSTLKYDGPEKSLSLTSITRVEHLGMSGEFFKNFLDELQQHSPFPHFGGYFSHLKSLEFEMTFDQVFASGSFPLELPMLCKLEEVKVKMMACTSHILLWPCCVLKSAPLLRRFVVEQHKTAFWFSDEWVEEDYRCRIKTFKEATKCNHPCLKVIEFLGFRGSASELELAKHLLSCAESLEKLVFDTRGKLNKYNYLKHWGSRIPSGAQLVLR